MNLFPSVSFSTPEFLAFKANFDAYINDSGFEVVTEHGQRIFRPKNVRLFTTHPAFEELFNHEVYIRNLPPEVLFPELLAFLKHVGRIYQIRLMLTFSGQTNGTAYVIFGKVSDSFDCINYLHGKHLTPTQLEPLEVELSANNNRLLLTNLPVGLTVDQVMSQFAQHNIEGVKEVKLRTLEGSNTANAIVVFYSHRYASLARRSLVPGLVKFDGRAVECDWYKPKDTKTLFLRFNRSSINANLITEYFKRFNTPLTNIEIQNNFAFVRFSSGEEAGRVLKIFQTQLNLPVWGNGLKLEKIDWPKRKGYVAQGPK